MIVIPAVDLRDGPLRAAARGPRRRRDRVLRRSRGHGAALGGAGRRAPARRRSRRRLRRRAPPDRAHRARSSPPCAGARRGGRRPARSRCGGGGAGGRRDVGVLGTRAAARPGLPRRGVPRAFGGPDHRGGRRARRSRGRARLDRGRRADGDRAGAGARARPAPRPCSTPTSSRDGTEPGPTSTTRPRWRAPSACRSSPRAAWASLDDIAALAAWRAPASRASSSAARSTRAPSTLRRRRRAPAAAAPDARQAHHPLPRREGRARGQGREVRRAARRRRSRGGRARLRRAGRRRAGVPRHHRVARGPRDTCSTSCAAPPRASTCRSRSAAACGPSTTCGALLRAGADKVSLNTAALARPEVIREAAERFGSQCIVVAIDARREGRTRPAGGSTRTAAAARPAATPSPGPRRPSRSGAGEILLTSMDRDGTKDGYDLELTRAVAEAVTVPVIASGGAGSLEHSARRSPRAAPTPRWPPRSSTSASTRSPRRRRTCADRGVEVRLVTRRRRSTYDAQGLIPAVVQEAETGEVLMVAWMNREAVGPDARDRAHALLVALAAELWRKGETSGHVQHVQGVYADCDADTLLVQVHQDGVACHTGARTCFFTATAGTGRGGRRCWTASSGSWPRARPRRRRLVRGRTAAKGEAAVCRKIGEEAMEVVTAALGGEGDRRVVEEVADLWFHTHGAARRAVDSAARRSRGAGAPARDAAGARSLRPARRVGAVPSAAGRGPGGRGVRRADHRERRLSRAGADIGSRCRGTAGSSSVTPGPTWSCGIRPARPPCWSTGLRCPGGGAPARRAGAPARARAPRPGGGRIWRGTGERSGGDPHRDGRTDAEVGRSHAHRELRGEGRPLRVGPDLRAPSRAPSSHAAADFQRLVESFVDRLDDGHLSTTHGHVVRRGRPAHRPGRCAASRCRPSTSGWSSARSRPWACARWRSRSPPRSSPAWSSRCRAR